MGIPRGSWSYWALSYSPDAEHHGKVNAECRRILVSISRHLPEDDSHGTGDLLGEIDSFLGNVSLGLRASSIGEPEVR